MRATIQEHALRLFREQGYDATSIEQIAEAAEVSPSTVFRYFPTKPDLVLYDSLDEQLLQEFLSQPSHLSPMQALRASLQSAFTSNQAELALQRDREQLIRNVPELRATVLDELARSVKEFARFLAARAGRPADDSEVLALAGATVGVAIAAWYSSEGDDAFERFQELLDVGMALLEGIQLNPL